MGFRRNIPIHVWGGLGSQLHAWYLYEYLRLRFPRRRFILVFHSSGVTRRMCELKNVLNGINWVQIDDFIEQAAVPKTFKANLFPVRLARSLVTSTRFVVSANTSYELKGIWMLTRSIRGHYSRLAIKPEVLSAMKKQAVHSGFNFFLAPKVETASMHIRLGDLIGLEGKSHTDFERINAAIASLGSNFGAPRIVIFSDSPELVLERIDDNKKHLVKVNPKDTNAWEEMSEMINSQYFIGTASKLSTWVCVLRTWINPSSVNYMPSDMAEILKDQLAEIGTPESVQYY